MDLRYDFSSLFLTRFVCHVCRLLPSHLDKLLLLLLQVVEDEPSPHERLLPPPPTRPPHAKKINEQAAGRGCAGSRKVTVKQKM